MKRKQNKKQKHRQSTQPARNAPRTKCLILGLVVGLAIYFLFWWPTYREYVVWKGGKLRTAEVVKVHNPGRNGLHSQVIVGGEEHYLRASPKHTRKGDKLAVRWLEGHNDVVVPGLPASSFYIRFAICAVFAIGPLYLLVCGITGYDVIYLIPYFNKKRR